MEIKVILCGRWVLDNNPVWVRAKFTQGDYFSFGTLDEEVELLL